MLIFVFNKNTEKIELHQWYDLVVSTVPFLIYFGFIKIHLLLKCYYLCIRLICMYKFDPL